MTPKMESEGEISAEIVQNSASQIRNKQRPINNDSTSMHICYVTIMGDNIKNELPLEPEVILTVKHEEEADEISSQSNRSDNTFQFINSKGEMKAEAASHNISNHRTNVGIPKFDQTTQATESPSPGPSAIPLSHHSDKPHVCDVCGKGFLLRSNLKQHMLVHTGIKPHVCSECGKGFTQLSNLKTHTIVHTGEKPHVCGVCGKAYTSLHNLKAHEYIHTGEKKRHICETCGQGFYQHGDLKTHKLIHTGLKPHVCGVCGKGFIKRGDLNVHMVVHTGEKPHACELCGKRFAQRWKLMKHSMVHAKKMTKTAVVKDISK
ncbi:zinc finger protein 239-like isoform X1 [Periplaneta americana]|uniref:zinc finger protein 239-like isoform X1 n=2 Tax=Periplaneta americana TaxID=6978 RepID=UPI0037E998B5